MAHNVTSRLDRKLWHEPTWVPYPASYGFPASYKMSMADGQVGVLRACQAAASRTDGPIVLLGYSQGAAVVHAVLNALDKSDSKMLWDDRVVGGANIASPTRRRDSSTPAGCYVPRPDRFGIGGEGPKLVDKWLFDVVAIDDPITDLPALSLLREYADLTEFMSITDMHEWGQDVMRKTAISGWPNLAHTIPSIREAVQQVRAYLPYEPGLNPHGGRHTAYATEKVHGSRTHCHVLADTLNWKMKKELRG